MFFSISILFKRFELIEGVYNSNHRYGCLRCTVEGKHSSHRMSFPAIDCSLRTDESFRNRLHPEHHKTTTPLEQLPIDMVNDFPTSDPLHLLELGITKTFLSVLKKGRRSQNSSLDIIDRPALRDSDMKAINDSLETINSTIPHEIHRSIRSIDNLAYWKGTEFRTFLLYSGMVALKGNIEKELYDHFLILSCAATLCSSETYKKYVVKRNGLPSLTEMLFRDYIEQFITLYGEQTISSNVHNLCHISNDIERFGNLNHLSTYPFENCLRIIKMDLKKCNRPLEQISRRITERASNESSKLFQCKSVSYPILKYPLAGQQNAFSTINLNSGFQLSCKRLGDKWFLSKDRNIMEMQMVIRNNTGKIMLVAKRIKEKENFFSKPFYSSFINIYLTNGETEEECYCSLEQILCKMFCMKYETKYVFVPLLHTMP